MPDTLHNSQLIQRAQRTTEKPAQSTKQDRYTPSPVCRLPSSRPFCGSSILLPLCLSGGSLRPSYVLLAPPSRPTIRVLDVSPLGHHPQKTFSAFFSCSKCRPLLLAHLIYSSSPVPEPHLPSHLPRRQAASQDLRGSISRSRPALTPATDCCRPLRSSTTSVYLCQN
ncbi:hypothetical protein LZ32DRAFT_129678 [Colletotrichum eremochloae]|nr:hypothetical protein LZ32DRAFT_129678 [Colletotrichum eremochloae]